MIERFAPNAGGVENVAWQVAHELHRQGADVTVLTRSTIANGLNDPDEINSEDTARPLRVQQVYAPSFWQPLRVIAFSRAIARVTAKNPFDLVHSFSRTHQQDLYRAGGGSHADYLQRAYSTTGSRLRQLSPRHRALLAIEARVFQDPAQRIQCASRLVADALTSEHGVACDRIFLLPNAVDANHFGTPESRARGRKLRAALDAKAERIWLFPASGWDRKGLASLIEAFARVADPGMRIWIAGRDDPRAWLRRTAKLGITDRIRFLGARDDLDAVYGAVDGVVLPTRYDAFANVTLEAAASRLPIVTTRANGACEVLSDAALILDDPRDIVTLASALTLLSDVAQSRALGERARRVALSLDWASHVSLLREEYARIVHAKGKDREGEIETNKKTKADGPRR